MTITAKTTLEQIESLATTLPPQDQLRLVAHISQRLSTATDIVIGEGSKDESAVEERLNLAKALLAEAEEIEHDSQGEFDAVEDIRRMRDERLGRLCQRDV